MPTFARRSPMPAPAAELYAWHARPAAFARLIPPWESVRVKSVEGPFGDGMRVTLHAKLLGPVGKDWVAEHFDTRPGAQFADRQLTGPFAEWSHLHRMVATGETTSELDDSVTYRLPAGVLGQTIGGGLVRRRLEAMFRFRHARTAADLARHQAFHSRPRLTVAITGSNGLIGNELAQFLAAGGHQVRRLERTADAPRSRFEGTATALWRPDAPLDPALLTGVDAVVHLAGEGIAEGRWSAAKKERVRATRVGPTRLVAEAVARAQGVRPVTLVSASAIGFYGSQSDTVLTEESPPGDDYLAQVAQDWEAATRPAQEAGARVVRPRFGVVLSPKAGALAKQLPAFKSGTGAVLGHGEQWVPWVSLDDAVGAIHHALMTPSVAGPVNVVAPAPVTNRVFGRTLAQVLGRPYLLTLPAVALRTLFGELADAALLASYRGAPTKLEAGGYRFEHPTLESALTFLLGKG